LGRLILVRHGETDSNASGVAQGRSDVPLSSPGYIQAKLIGEYLNRTYSIDRVVASDRVRCVETAKWIDAPITTSAMLREIDFGDWEGQKWSDIRQDYPVEYNKARTGDQAFVPPHGEPKTSFVARVDRVIDQEGFRTSAGAIAVVAHDGVLRTLLTTLLGWPATSSSKLTLFVGSISLITTRSGEVKLDLLNYYDHLAPSYSETVVHQEVSISPLVIDSRSEAN